MYCMSAPNRACQVLLVSQHAHVYTHHGASSTAAASRQLRHSSSLWCGFKALAKTSGPVGCCMGVRCMTCKQQMHDTLAVRFVSQVGMCQPTCLRVSCRAAVWSVIVCMRLPACPALPATAGGNGRPARSPWGDCCVQKVPCRSHSPRQPSAGATEHSTAPAAL